MKGIEFFSAKNNSYFYDDESGFIYTDKTKPNKTQELAQPTQPLVDKTKVENHLTQYGFKQLILEMTQKCNLRCKYCCYGEHYHSTRGHGNTSMDFETAKTALDFYMENFKKTCYKNPLRKPTITFYGGEPLINLELIKKFVAYFKAAYPDYEADYNLTTNGLLLSEETAAYLVENRFSVIVSLDGNKENHDRNRVKINNEGSFDEVFKNINSFKKKYPNYGKLGFSVCMDYHTDLFKMADFVKENNLFVVLVNMASDLETDYYEQFTSEDIKRFNSQLEELRKQYFETASKDGILFEEKNLLLAIFAYTYLEFATHSLVYEKRPEFLPYTTSCVPGEKIYVTIDGRIHMCERISANFPIGTINKGIEYENIIKYINQYNSFYEKCRNCPITRLCNICLAKATAKNEIVIPENYCQERYEAVKKTLIDYVNLMEGKPNQLDKVVMSYYNDLREKTGDILD